MSAAVRDRVSRINVRALGSRVGGLRFSAFEIAALVATVVIVVSTIVYYVRALAPEQKQLSAVQSEYELQRKGIRQNAQPSTDQPSPADRAQKAIDSLDSFKKDHLTSFESGRITLINELNALVKKHGLQLTSGIDMSTGSGSDVATAPSGVAKSRKKTDELQNVYPNLTIRTTVFGQYDNLRSFVSDVERNKQLLLINSMSLVNQDARATSTKGPRRSAGSEGITLTIEMQAFFRPENDSQ